MEDKDQLIEDFQRMLDGLKRKRWAQVKTVAEYLNVSKPTIFRWKKDHSNFPKAKKIGAVVLFDLNEIDEWLEQFEWSELKEKKTKQEVA